VFEIPKKRSKKQRRKKAEKGLDSILKVHGDHVPKLKKAKSNGIVGVVDYYKGELKRLATQAKQKRKNIPKKKKR